MIGARKVKLWAGVLLMTAALPSQALAQSSRWQAGVAGVFTGSASAGTVEATLIDPTGAPFTLYRTTNRILSGWGAEGQVARRLSDRWRLELAIGWNKTDFESEISSDFENVPAVSASQAVDQFTGELALAYRLVQRDRFEMFLRAGGGGFREVTSDRALVDNGWRASAGGGALIRVRGRLALRAEARMLARGKGIAFGDARRRLSPSVVAGLVFGY